MWSRPLSSWSCNKHNSEVNTGNSAGHSVRTILFAHCLSNYLDLRNLRLFWAVRLCHYVSSCRPYGGSFCHHHHHHQRSNSRLFLLDFLTLKMEALLSSETPRAIISNDETSQLLRLECLGLTLSAVHISHGSENSLWLGGAGGGVNWWHSSADNAKWHTASLFR